MKINKLTLHNFGIYAGNHTLDLRNEKPVILIGGMNGYGKTTILEAVLLSLYGRRSFAIEENKLSFSAYLNKLINNTDGTQKASVEISFTISWTDSEIEYTVHRSWDGSKTTPKLKTTVHKDGIYDSVLSDNWDVFIEEMLPSAIAPFFFFDGEKISDMALTSDESYMKNSVKTLLGIDIVDKAIHDIERAIKKYQKKVSNVDLSKDIETAENDVHIAEKNVKKQLDQIGQLDIRIRKLGNKLARLKDEYSAAGGNLLKSRNEMLAQRTRLSTELDILSEKLMKLSHEDLPLLLVQPLLEDILSTSHDEKEQQRVNVTLENLPKLYKEYDSSESSGLIINEFIDYVKSTSKDIPEVFNLSNSTYYKLDNMLNTSMQKQKNEVNSIQKKRHSLINKIHNADDYLSISINEEEVESKLIDILELTEEIAKMREQYSAIEVEIEEQKAKVALLEKERNKLIEIAVKDLEYTEEVNRIIEYSQKSLDVLNAYKVRLQEAKTKHLADTMTVCFKEIITKQNLIDVIKIDPATLSFEYYDALGQPVKRSSLSAGEKQLLVISMLWSLGICSRKTFPVIVDTPLARLDSNHRGTLINNYFPKASIQTVLLSTDSEIYGEYYKMLGEYIDKEYTLNYDAKQKQTKIIEGYFNHVKAN